MTAHPSDCVLLSKFVHDAAQQRDHVEVVVRRDMLRLQAEVSKAAQLGVKFIADPADRAGAEKMRAYVQAEVAAKAEVFVQQMRMVTVECCNRMAVGQRQVDAEVKLGAAAKKLKRVAMRWEIGHDAGCGDIPLLVQIADGLVDAFGQAAVIGGEDQLRHGSALERLAQAAANSSRTRFCFVVKLMKGRTARMRDSA